MFPVTNLSTQTAGAASARLPAVRVHTLARLAGVLGFAMATALSAQVAIPLPHTPVPVTLQTLAVLLAGVTLGPRLGALSLALYLLLGSAGYHFFAGGHWGFQTVLGATGGYLIGFLLAQPLLGLLTRRSWPLLGLYCGRAPHRAVDLVVALLAANAVILGGGVTWLYFWSGAGLAATLSMGLWPFLPGEAAKTAAAFVLGRAALRYVRPWMDAD